MENNETTTFGTVKQQKAEKREQNNRSGWQTVTIGGVSGILMGAGGMYAADAFAAGEEPAEETANASATTTSATTASTTSSHVADNGLQVAEVDQGLSFGEAFAAAREAVGSGGVFHWHGNIYNTYTAAEWENMTAAEHQQFAQQVQPEVRPGEGPHKNDVAQHVPKVERQEGKTEGGSGDESGKREEESEVRFLGVGRVETANGPWNVGHMVRGEQEVALVDMDDDYVFDVEISDRNRNGKCELDEIRNISDAKITVTDFALASAQQEVGSATDAQPETAAHTQQDQIGEDMPDYMNDADMQTI
jgi:hypothetical protein